MIEEIDLFDPIDPTLRKKPLDPIDPLDLTLKKNQMEEINRPLLFRLLSVNKILVIHYNMLY